MKTMMKGLVMAAGAAMMVLASHGSAAAQDRNAFPTTVTVQNNRAVPVVVYLDQGQFDTRLGTVAPNSTATLPLPKYLSLNEPVDVIVHPEGAGDLSVGPITLEAGRKLEVLVPINDNGYMPPPPPEVIPNPGEGTTTVTVENPRERKVTLYLEQGNFDIRLGVVPPHQEQTLTIPASLTEGSDEVELFVHPEGGADLSSQLFQLKPGAHLLVKVPLH